LLFGWQQKSILGEFVRKFESASVWADLAFTPDGQYVLGLGFDPACVYVCKADTLAVVREIGKANLKNGQRLSLTSDGHVLVSDIEVNCVWVFRLDGTLVRQIGSKGKRNGQLNHPLRTTCSTSGQVYVPEGGNNRISVFNLADGSFVRHIGRTGSGNGQLNTPGCVALSPDEKELFVTDCNNRRVQVFSVDGCYLRQWGKAGAGPGEFDEPSCVLVTAAGEALVADCDNHRIQVFGMDGTFKCLFGSEGDDPGQFQQPFLMALSAAGELYIIEFVSNHVHIFT
jgi:DNA-binding beta-propeller fold protein YncE